MNNVSRWSLNDIIYEIYPRSFQDSNNDGIGDLEGIISRLDYLVELGINAVWICPIYPSPQHDFGYDVSEYKDIDPIFGSLEIFNKLIIAGHEKDIKIMMDFVPNHTSSEHPWFKESSSSKDNSKRDWYIWHKGHEGGLPNNWLSIFGGSAWEKDRQTDEYYLHTFDKTQPDLNWRNPEVVKEMLSVLRFWMDLGVDGFRVDSPHHLIKDGQFRDEPPNPDFDPTVHNQYNSLLHIRTSLLPESIFMMKKIAEVTREYENKFIVNETWTTLPKLIEVCKAIGAKNFAPFNFSLITQPWNALDHKQHIDEYTNALGDLYYPCYVLENHDVGRIASRIGKEQSRVAAMLLLTLRGLPFIYYGEELGMENEIILESALRDVSKEKTPGLVHGRDPVRTPMHWDETENAGFSKVKPWLPVSSTGKQINAELQKNDKRSMLSFYKKLIHLRKRHIALSEGAYIPLPIPADNVFAFIREKHGEKIVVILNFDGNDKKISLDFKNARVLASTLGASESDKKIDFSSFELRGNEGIAAIV